MNEADRQRRAARRAFIRACHPDHGGNEHDFMTGLAELDNTPTDRPARVYVAERKSWAGALRASVLSLRRRNRVTRVR